ncbi:MAG: DNRLRE domain-containing protein, partial [Longispora sp.]|nr:DNRLRE domain-containing protein [Longispora sp. (in: high G+C Gram-positive bacteria)]
MRRIRHSGLLRSKCHWAVGIAFALVIVLTAGAASPACAIEDVSTPAGESWPSLWNWLQLPTRDKSVSLPDTPQQITGTAKGLAHHVGPDDTRVEGGNGRPPGTAPGELPEYQAQGTTAKPFTTRSASAASAFDPATSKQVDSATSETSEVFANTDGSYTRHTYAGPVNFRGSDGAWHRIDPNLTVAPDRRSHAKANSVAVSFAPNSSDPDLASVTTTAGQTISYSMANVTSVPSVVDGPRATYPGVSPHTDLVIESVTGGLKESVVLHSADAATTWLFPLRLRDVTAREAGESIEFLNTAGVVVATIPAGEMFDSKVDEHSGLPATSKDVRYRLVEHDGGQALEMSADATWIKDPSRVFPITVDPSVSAIEGAAASTFADTQNPGDNSGKNELYVGTYNGGGVKAYSFLQFANFGNNYAGNRMTAVNLRLFNHWAWTCEPQPFSVNPVTSPWTPSGVRAYPGPSFGPAIGTTTQHPGEACKNSAPHIGTWMSVPLQTSTFDSWITGASPNYGLAITASQSNSKQWKKFNSAHGGNPPYLELTFSPNVPPQVEAQYPTNNAKLNTLTPELSARAHDPDNWPGPLKYEFRVYDTDAKELVNSGLVSENRWVVPPGVMSWGKSYLYTALAHDGHSYNENPTFSLVSTHVPQPAVTSKLSQNGGPQGFDPSIGNYTTSAVDAQISVVGPALSIKRDYNSLDPRTHNAFGAGWSSLLDAEVIEHIATGATKADRVVLTYPDGQQAAFGRSPDGTFTQPQGRFVTFTAVADGYTLADKSGTVYSFTHRCPNCGHGYRLASVTDASARALTFTYAGPDNKATRITSASGRSLHLHWADPQGAGNAHVVEVRTDPVSADSPETALTWKYQYEGDQLTQVCQPGSQGACTRYGYVPTSHAPSTILDASPRSYWRLNETSGSGARAESSVLANQGADDATYTDVTLGRPGPYPGSGSTAAEFNGKSSFVALPDSLVDGLSYRSTGMWFTTTGTSAVLMGYQADRGTTPIAKGGYVPALYVGTDGKLVGGLWGPGGPMTTPGRVNDGKWHHVMLTASGATQTLYLDGRAVATKNAPNHTFAEQNLNIGSGYLGGTWPNQKHQSNSDNTGHVSHFSGSIAEVVTYDQPLTAATVEAIYRAGANSASVLSSVTRPSGTRQTTVDYNKVTGLVSKVTDANGGTWKLGDTYVAGTSQVYAAAITAAPADGYWRLGESAGMPVDQVNTGSQGSVYNRVTLGVTGPYGEGQDTAAKFDGVSSYARLATRGWQPDKPFSAELWFTSDKPGGVLLSSQVSAEVGPEVASDPILWVGTDGKLLGAHRQNPIQSENKVTDGKWHHVVYTTSAGGTTLYVDGVKVGSTHTAAQLSGPSAGLALGVGGNSGQAQVRGLPDEDSVYFAGTMAEVSVHHRVLTAEDVSRHFAAHKSSEGLTPMRIVSVTDPGGKEITYHYDASSGDRLIRQIDALGNTTTYGYDTGGFLHSVVDPNGERTVTGHDVRGNTVSQTTCQNRREDKCSTAYFTYFPDATSKRLAPDPRNDLVLTQRDSRSASAQDDTYLTSYTYDARGNRTAVATPPVPGFPAGRTTTMAYTDGTTEAVGGGTVP